MSTYAEIKDRAIRLSKVQELTRKIEALKSEQNVAMQKDAITLYKKLESMLGANFSAQLVVGMVGQMTQISSPADYIKLYEQGAAFFRPRTLTKQSKAKKAETQNGSAE